MPWRVAWWIRPVWPALLLLAVSLGRPALAADGDLRAPCALVEAKLRDDGSLWVHEQTRLRIGKDPIGFFTRRIPLSRMDGVSVVNHSDSLAIKKRPRSLDLIWRFPACRDTERTFTVDYILRGALALERGRLALCWSPVSSDRAYPIDSATASILIPASLARDLRWKVEPGRASAAPDSGGQRIAFATLALPAYEGETMSLDLATVPAGFVPPLWQKSRDAAAARLRLVLICSAILGLGASAALLLWKRVLLVRREAAGGVHPPGAAPSVSALDAGAIRDRRRLYMSARLALASACILLVAALLSGRRLGPSVLFPPAALFLVAAVATQAADSYPSWSRRRARRT